MFEEMTYEKIMADMMADMPDGVDTSEGSLLFNACAKQAVRLEEAYLKLNGIEKNMFVDTADLEHLIRAGNERACYIEQATYAEFEAEFNCPIPPGSRFNCDEYNYTMFRAKDEEQHIYILGCDSSGSEPNHILGDLEPIEFIEGFEWGRLTKCVKEGKDIEETEPYRARILSTYNYKGFAGNREYYMSRVKELPGVMGCKLERVQAPSDRVKITIIGEHYKAPSDETVQAVQTAVDPVVNSGEGEGLAPIGHRVTILAVGETQINIETKITYDSGHSYEDLQSYIEQAVDDYLLELRKTWESTNTIVIRVLQIEAAIVSISGIVDVTRTKINGSEANLQITDRTVPVKGAVTCL